MAEKTPALQELYNGLSQKNPQLQKIGFENFQNDMRNDDNLMRIYNGVSQKNPQLKKRGFDKFRADMFPEYVGPVQATPEILPNQTQPNETGGFGKEMLLHTAKGLGDQVYKGLINLPDNALRIMSQVTNPIAKALGIPEYNPGDINKVTGIDNVNQYLSDQSQSYKKQIEEINPRVNEGVIGAIQKGDVGQAFRNLSAGLSESLVPSAMMMVLPASGIGTTGQIAGSAAMFGSARLKELDETMPELPEAQKLIAANVNGALEGIFETYFGSGAVGDALVKNIIQKEGLSAGKQTIKSGVKQMFSDMLTKYPALAPLGEMYEEMGTQVAQNITDKLTGVNPEVKPTDGMWEAGILGLAGGAVHGGMIGGAQKLSSPLRKMSEQKIVRQNIESNLQPLINKNTGKVHIITNELKENFFLIDETPDGMYVVSDTNGETKMIGKDNFTTPVIVEPEAVISGDLKAWEQDYTQRAQAEAAAETLNQKIAKYPEQFEINGRFFRFNQSPQNIRFDEQGNIQSLLVTETGANGEDIGAVPMEIASSEVDKYMSDQEQAALKQQEQLQKEAEKNQNDTSVPTGDNNLSDFSGATNQNVAERQIPVLEDGSPDYDNMEPDMFFEEYSKEFGQEEAISEVTGMKQAIDEKIKKLTEKKAKSTSVNERASIGREIKTLTDRVQKITSILPTQEVRQEPISQSESGQPVAETPERKLIPRRRPGIGKTREAASKIETVDPYHKALQYFVSGGKVNKEGLNSLLGSKTGKSIEGERKARISYYSPEGLTIDDIAHKLWEDNGGIDNRYSSDEYKNAVEDAILAHNHPSRMALELIDTYNRGEQQPIYPEEFNDEYVESIADGIVANNQNNEEISNRLDSFLAKNNINDWFTPEDLLSSLEQNKNLLSEEDYNTFTNFVKEDINNDDNGITEFDFTDIFGEPKSEGQSIEPITATGELQGEVSPVEGRQAETTGETTTEINKTTSIPVDSQNLSESVNNLEANIQNVSQNKTENVVNTPVSENVNSEKFTKNETDDSDLFQNLSNIKENVVVKKQINSAAKEVNTEPTEAQKEAGNYKKGHVNIQGFDITIENPKGSFRRGIDEDGKAWETEMKSHYGYFKRTNGKDGDHIDTFIGESPLSQTVFVVDQNNPKTGEFDESKVMLGYNSPEEAKEAYMANYDKDWKGFGSITAVPVEEFKTWLYDGAKQRKPFSEYVGTPEPTFIPTGDLITDLENIKKSNKISNFDKNQVNEKKTTYKTQSGESIQYSLAFGSDNQPTPNNLQREADRQQNPSLRKLRPGEIASVENKYTLDKNFVFDGSNKIESHEDVAYLFRQLENKSVENMFAALIDENGKPTIIHISMGGRFGTVIDFGILADAVNRFNPSKVYLIHNHPSGNLKASDQDLMIHKKAKEAFGDVVGEHIIINTTSGQYASFNNDWDYSIYDKPNKAVNPKNYKVIKLDKQIYKNNTELPIITAAEDVASFITAQRFTDGNKLSTILLGRNNQIKAYLHLPSVDFSNKNAVEKLTSDLQAYAGRFGGVNVILSGNTQKIETDRSLMKNLDNLRVKLKSSDINLLDFISVKPNGVTSLANEGILEPKAEYGEPAILQRKTSPIGFYSTIESALEQIKQEKGTAGQFEAMLLKNGAKQAELDWMGWKEQFPSVNQKVTKEDIQNWIYQNKIEVEEVIKGETRLDSKDVVGKELKNDGFWHFYFKDGTESTVYDGGFRREELIEMAVKNRNKQSGDNTKYSQYQLPGGENYKEVLLTMPTIGKVESLEEFAKRIGKKPEEVEIAYRVGLQTGAGKSAEGDSRFRSSHFDEPNILAHIRFNEREVNGEKVLFIEEIQSDWAQKGKKEGFKEKEFVVTYFKDGEGIKTETFKSRESAETFVNEVGRENISSSGIRELNNGNVPDMPFKKTDQWVNLALRRMMRYAAENGFDRIAWTNGEMQAARYDLSKQVDKITYNKKPSNFEEGKIFVSVHSGSNTLLKGNMTPSEIEDQIGKELTKKIVDGDEYGTIEGDGLKIGGSGMKAFYDSIVPSAASKLGKPFDAKVELIQIDVKPDITDEGIDLETGDIKEVPEGKYATVQSLPVTNKMVDSVKQGVPLFRQSDSAIDAALNTVSEMNQRFEMVKEIADNYSKKFGVPVEVVRNETFLPRDIQNQLKRIGAKKGESAGLFDTRTGKVYLVSNNITSPEMAEKAILHEVVGHYGIRSVIGVKNWDKLLSDVADFMGEKKVADWGKKLGIEDRKMIADEFLAYNSENVDRYESESGIMDKAVAWLRKMLRNIFPNLRLTKNDIRQLIINSKKALEKPKADNFDSVKDFAEALAGYKTRERIMSRIIGEKGARNLDNAEEVTTRLDNLAVAREMEQTSNNPFSEIKVSEIKEDYDLTEDNEWKFEADLMEALGRKLGGGRFDYQRKGDAIIRVKGHTPNWGNFIEDVEENGVKAILNITVGDYNNRRYYDNKTTEEQFSEQYPDVDIIDIEISDGESLSSALEYVKNELGKREHFVKQFTPQQIRLATGWERGVDGLWRYEVLDSDINIDLLKELNKNNELSNQNVTFDLVTYKVNNDNTYDISLKKKGATKTSEFVEYKNISKEDLIYIIDNKDVSDKIIKGEGSNSFMGANLDDAKEFKTEFTTFITGGEKLTSIVNDKELFKAYPQLKNVIVKIDKSLGIGAQFSTQTDRTKVISIGSVSKQTKSSIAHEIQHAIQDIEGFAKGGDVKSQEKPSEYLESMYNDIEALVKFSKDYNIEPIDVYNKLKGTFTHDDVARNNSTKSVYELENILLQAKTNRLSPIEKYRHLAGEVESRNVQTRINMTPEERLNTLLSETEDVAREDQIILIDGLGVNNNSELNKSFKEIFQERYFAIQDLKDSGVKRLKVNSDATVSVYHGTSLHNWNKIQKEGFNESSFFSVSKSGTEYGDSPLDVAKRKFGKDGIVVEVRIDPRDLSSAAAGSELYSEKRLVPKDGYFESQIVLMDGLGVSNLEEGKPSTITINGVERPTTNSKGQPIADTEEKIKNFWKWFGDSKVVDEQGRPLVVYHGAPDARFVEEDGTFKNHDQKWGREGGLSQHWFAKDRIVASTYADDRRAFDYQKAIPGIIDAYIKLENPLIINGEFKNWRDAQSHGKTKTVVDKAREEERDGVIIKNVKDNYNNNTSSKATDTYAVFSNTQIKSATGNIGTFNTEEPSILLRKITDPEEAKNYVDEITRDITKKPTKIELNKIINVVRQAIQDRDLPIRSFMDEVLKRGGIKKDDADPYRDITLAHGRGEKLLKNFEQDYISPIISALSEIKNKANVNHETLVKYVMAKSAPGRNKMIRDEKFKKWAEANVLATEDEIQSYKSGLEKTDFSGVLSLNYDDDGNVLDKQWENMPDDYANEISAKFEEMVGDEKLISNLWDAINKAGEFTLQRWVDGNQMTETTKKKLLTENRYYVPLKGWWDDAAKTVDYHTGMGTGKSLKKAEGRTSLADDPFSYIEQQGFKAISEQTDNEVKMAMYRFLMDNMKGNEDIIHLNRIYQVTDPVTGETEYTTERPAPELFSDGLAKMVTYTENLKNRKPSQGHEHEVWVNTGYGTVAMVFNDEHIETALALNKQNDLVLGLNVEAMNKVMGGSLGWVNNIQKALFTSWNVVFAPKNILRDVQETESYLLTKDPKAAKAFTKEIGRSFKTVGRYLYNNKKFNPQRDNNGKALNDDAMLEDFMMAGGQTGWTHLKTPEQYQAEIKRKVKVASGKKNAKDMLLAFGDVLSTYSQLFEDTTRFSVYKSGVLTGMSVKDSAYMAKEAVTNFNRKGKITKTMDAVYAFFNPAIQGAVKNIRMAKVNPKAFAAVSSAWVVLGVLMAELNRLFDDDDEKYERINPFVRMNYLVVPTGDSYVRVPLAPFFRGFYAMGSNISDMVHGKVEPDDAFGRSLLNFANGMSPVDITSFFAEDEKWYGAFVPTIFRPAYDVSNNRDFMGYPITKEAFTKELERTMANSKMGKDNVNAAIKFITDTLFELSGGDADSKYKSYFDKEALENNQLPPTVNKYIDINPSVVEYYIKTYTGGTGAMISDLFNMLTQVSTGGNITIDNIPLVNSFVRNYPEKKYAIIGDYYKMAERDKRWREIANEKKKQGDTEIFTEILNNSQRSKEHRAISIADKQLDMLKKRFDRGLIDFDQYMIEKANIMERAIKNTK